MNSGSSRSVCTDNASTTFCAQKQTYWRDRWQQQRLALLEARNSEGNSFWNDKKGIKKHFIRDLNEWREQAEARIAGMGIKDGTRVLDIGAGTGTLSVPLAAHGCNVTAVEPSPVMGEALVEYQREQKTREINLIQKRWEDVSLDELGEPVRRGHCILQSHGDRYRGSSSQNAGMLPRDRSYLLVPYPAALGAGQRGGLERTARHGLLRGTDRRLPLAGSVRDGDLCKPRCRIRVRSCGIFLH